MIFARYLAHGEIAYGVVEGDTVKQITASPFEKFEVTDHTHPISDVKLLAPCEPAKIVAVGLNYRSHPQNVQIVTVKVAVWSENLHLCGGKGWLSLGQI